LKAATPVPSGDSVEAPERNRFVVSVVAALRSHQLHGGSRPRIDVAERHKATSVAVLEVEADAVSWSTEP
jgi:DNA-directed RNA polymerase subunit K/omega